MAVHGIKDTLRAGVRGRSASASWNNGVESPSIRKRESLRRKISNGLNGMGWGYDGSDSSGAGGSEDGNNDGSQLVSTPKRIGSTGSLATMAERSLAAGTGGDGGHHGRSNGGLLGTMACEVQPVWLGSLDLTLRNLGVGLGEGLGGLGFGGVASVAAGGGGGRSSRRVSMQYQSW